MVPHLDQPKHRGQPLKLEARLISPDLNIRLPPMPEQLPSYMSVHRPVVQHRISEARHALLGPKVRMYSLVLSTTAES
jgi:hypothetical protein